MLWPLWISIAIAMAMTLLPLFCKFWRTDPWGAVCAAATCITAGAAISIPLIIDSNAKATRTADQLNDLDRKLVEALEKKQDMDQKNGRIGISRFEKLYIKSDPKLESVVYRILNDYEYVCLGVNKGIFVGEVLKSLRWDALAATWLDYQTFINSHRSENVRQASAWIECEKWLLANPHPTIK